MNFFARVHFSLNAAVTTKLVGQIFLKTSMTQCRLMGLIITVGGGFLNVFNNFPFLQRCLSSLEQCYKVVFCQFSELFWWISVT